MPATFTQIPETPERTPVSILAELHENLFRADARIGAMWPWPCHVPSDDLKDEFNFIQMRDVPEKLLPVFEALGELALDRLHDGDDDAFDELATSCCGRGLFGWLARVEFPHCTASSDTSATSSWGHYHQILIFEQDANAVLATAERLQNEHFAKVLEAHKNRMGAA